MNDTRLIASADQWPVHGRKELSRHCTRVLEVAILDASGYAPIQGVAEFGQVHQYNLESASAGD